MITSFAADIWRIAQIAEKDHWSTLWLPANSPQRKQTITTETQKGDFIFNELMTNFKVNPAADWIKLSILDVGCGPLSIIARNQFGKTRAGVDPLNYPKWTHDSYAKNGFKCYLKPFEDFELEHKKFDVIIFYNALQHFANLEAVAKRCRELLSKKGTIYLSEYLKVPTNEAHIQYLEKDTLDTIFKRNGFNVTSRVKNVWLPNLVERPGGLPIELYLGQVTF